MQPNHPYSPEDVARYRIDKATRCLQAAKSALSTGDVETAVNRSYYCIFNAMRAILALDRFDSKKHSGVISAIQKGYIRTGIFPKSFSDIIENAFEIRIDGDYEDFFLISKADVAAQVDNAKIFVDTMEKYVGERIQKA